MFKFSPKCDGLNILLGEYSNITFGCVVAFFVCPKTLIPRCRQGRRKNRSRSPGRRGRSSGRSRSIGRKSRSPRRTTSLSGRGGEMEKRRPGITERGSHGRRESSFSDGNQSR